LTALAIQKTIGAAFFLFAVLLLVVLQIRNVTHPLQALFSQELREDPHDVLANLLIRLVPEVSRTTLSALTLVSAGYLALHVIEAGGLWLRWLWVEYLILIETAAFMPYEIYELVRRPTLFKGGILLVNLLIVAYLAQRRWPWRRMMGTH
jgi:uncharacterized membrane protein (DUF2068 family)